MSDLLVETIPTLSFDKQYMNNSKIGRIISTKPIEIVEECSELTIPVHGEIINIVDIWKDRNVSLSAYNITQFDMAVMDAAYTIINSGYTIIAPEWILKVMSGNMNARATPKKINAIKDSVDKLRSIHIQIDCTQEVNSRKDLKGKISKFVYKSYLLPLGELEVTYASNGKEVTAYTIYEKPALYRYAEIVHQIIDVPAELLETQEKFNDTEESILIKRYVVRRIAQIAHKNNLRSNKISFLWYDNKSENDRERGLYPELGYFPENYKDWKSKRKQINNVVKNTLQFLVDKNTIQDFKEYRNNDSNNPSEPIMGYKIFLVDTKV